MPTAKGQELPCPHRKGQAPGRRWVQTRGHSRNACCLWTRRRPAVEWSCRALSRWWIGGLPHRGPGYRRGTPKMTVGVRAETRGESAGGGERWECGRRREVGVRAATRGGSAGGVRCAAQQQAFHDGADGVNRRLAVDTRAAGGLERVHLKAGATRG
eukprot:4224589-Prymnesium_polylepis.1